MTVTTIYVYLPREAVPVWAPVDAEHVRGNIYRILDCRGEDEHVEFWKGLSVKCQFKHFDDGEFLVAYEAIDDG